jgi:PAS domain S-box-containing protein
MTGAFNRSSTTGKMLPRWVRRLGCYGLALLLVLAGAIIRWALTRLVGSGLPTYITFYPAVMLAALVGGVGPGLLATLATVLLVDYWLLPPAGFGIEKPIDAVGLAFFLAMGVFMSIVAGLYRRTRGHLEELVVSRTTALRQTNDRLQLEITERQQVERGIRRVKEEWERTFDSVPDLIAILDNQHHVVRVNRAMAQRLGTTPELCLGVPCYRAVHGMDAPPPFCPHSQTLCDSQTHIEEVHEDRLGGDFLVTTTPLTDERGKFVGSVHVARDITERKRAEEQLRKLNRTLKALSDSSHALMRATEESAYLEEVCKIIVEDCGHAMVWVGYAEEGEAKSIRPVAHAGFEEGYLETLRLTWADTERGRGPTGTAIRTARPVVCPNMLTDPRFAPWREQAVKRGYASSIALPLWSGGKAFGALTIYSREPDPFSPDEVKLLEDLAADLTYGISSLRLQAAHAQAAESLRESQEYLSTVVRMSPAAIFVTREADGLYFEANEAYLKLIKYPAEEVLGHTSLELNIWVDPEDRRKVIDALRRYGHIENSETRFRCRTGEVVDVLYSATSLEQAGERRVLGALMDITERKRAEESLRKAHDELEMRVRERTAELHAASLYARSLIEASLDPLVTISTDGKITDVNQATELVTGVARRQLIGSSFSDYFTEPEKANAGYQQVIREGLVRDYPLTIRHVSGRTTDVLYNATVYCNEAGVVQGVFAAARDVTERKRAEAELARHREHLEELVQERSGQLKTANERLQEQAADLVAINKDLEQFAYIASHDLQEPLRAVGGFITLLRQRYEGKLDEAGDRYIDATVDGVKRMQALIEGLLEYSRVGTRGNVQAPTSAADALKIALQNLQTRIQESGAVITSDALPTVQADAMQLTRLFQNLISNAIKFCSERPPQIHVGSRRKEDAWLFWVRDNGIGIEPQYNERIFLIFQRLHTRTKYPGTGIGLAICKRIVERHGGSIWVESQPGQGSTFYFTLPDREETNEPSAK